MKRIERREWTWGYLGRVLFATALILLIFGVNAKLSQACGCEGTIFEGQSQIEVMKRCGKPTIVSSPEELYIKNGDQVRKTDVVTWTYNFGDHCFLLELTFRGNVLYKINRGEFGF